jgi:hypothetical protein
MDKARAKIPWKLVSTLIGGCVTIGVAFIAHRREQAAPEGHVFTGVVRSEDGSPVARARVNVFQDGKSQILYSDNDGVFHFIEANEKQYLKITVEADGFDFFSRDTDPQRTGPEELYLRRKNLTDNPNQNNPGPTTYGQKSPIIIGNHNEVPK